MMTIYVGNLNYQSTEEDIQGLFGQYGDVNSVKIIIDRESGRSRGFGFVEMENDVAERAIESLNGMDFNGRNLKVHEAKDRAERGAGGFRSMNRGERRPSQGGWRQR
jgi:RNA recognition motif-containing protein